MKHEASDGSKWHIEHNPVPVPTRSCDWQYSHEDYDGAPDSGDDRCGFADSEQDAKDQIEEYLRECQENEFAGNWRNFEWEQNPER